MKELTIEEKANRYDKAIEIAKSKIKNDKNHVLYEDDVIEIFPELKEDKNESIRKWFIEYFQGCKSEGIEEFDVGVKVDDIIDWLEKQHDDKDISLLEVKAKAYDDAKERMSYAYNQNRVPIGFISEIFPNLNYYDNQDNKLKGKSALEAIREKRVDNANKIELKFKIGDWVVFMNKHQSIYQIEKIEDGYYILRHTHGGTFRVCILHDENLRLWTIKDAKDGDILVSISNQPFIYNGKITEITIGAYCGLNVYGVFVVEKYLKESNWSCNDNIKPATNEQREILIKEIHKANFKWDANKKELIKL